MKTRIKDLREEQDLTQKELSQYLNISQVAYSYYEINKRNIPLEILSKLADFYNTSTDYFLYRTNEIHPYKQRDIWVRPKCLTVLNLTQNKILLHYLSSLLHIYFDNCS